MKVNNNTRPMTLFENWMMKGKAIMNMSEEERGAEYEWDLKPKKKRYNLFINKKKL